MIIYQKWACRLPGRAVTVLVGFVAVPIIKSLPKLGAVTKMFIQEGGGGADLSDFSS